MNFQSLRSRAIALVAGIALLATSAFASADPPSQVIRLGYTTGAVSFSPAGEDDWVRATLNRPLTIGDRVWVDAGGRAELQIGGSMLRLNGPSGVTVLNLEDNLAQLQLTQGAMNVRVRHLDPSQVIEIDTPNLAFTVRQAGSYRIAVDTDGNATDVIVRKGRAEVYGDGASYVLDSRQSYRFYDTSLQDYEQFGSPQLDDFDRWASDRDRRFDTSISARYVSQDVIGYQDLDTYGTWRNDPAYGNVWIPSRLTADWAPYRDGHWAWVDPWGWTWVDDAPWGFAVSHYGRWARVGGNWGWVPGPARSRAYYAPAVVAFVGGNNFQLSISSGNVGAVGWFPLGPREVYRPWYSSSRRYFEQVNVSNTVVNTTVINNYYNNTNVTNVNYVNRGVPGAVVAVPTTAFVQSQQVARSAVRMTPQMAASAPVTQVAAVAPTERSVRGSAVQGGTPPARVFERQVVARTAPAPAQANFAAQRQQLEKQPGKPLDDTARREVRGAPATAAPPVKVLAQSQAAPPTAAPPPATDAGKGERVRRTPGAPGGATAAQEKGAPAQERGAPPQVVPPGQVAQPGAPTQPAERGKGRERGQQPGQQATEATPGTPPQVAVPDGQQPRVSSPTQTRIQQQAQQPGTPPPTAAAPQAAPEGSQRRTPPGREAQEQARQGEQAKARESQAAQQQQQQTRQAEQQTRQAEQQTRQAEQQKARESQAAQQQQQQTRQAEQQTRQAEQQKAREAQAAQQQQQTRQAEQQKAREAQAAQQQQQQQTRQAEQQKAREAQAAQQQQARQAAQQQQQARQAEQQKAREAQAVQQQQQQQARQAQAAQQQQQARQAQQAEQQARQAQAAQQQQQARQAQAAQQQQAQQPQQPAPRQAPEQRGRGKDDDQKREEEAKKQRG